MDAARSSEPTPRRSGPPLFAIWRWWRREVVSTVDHARVTRYIIDESGWTARFMFMTLMSAGIAVLGLLLSSPAVVIGAMLISPLMSPIIGLGFSLALFDSAELRRSLTALALGTLAAVAVSALIVLCSPLKAATTEILARTRPNLFDLLVAMFAALAGTFAIIRGRGETVVGVAIATALMPPLAVVGYGLATWNMAVFGGSLALFVTNFVTIALSAAVMARLYGFGHSLSSQQSWAQTLMLLLVFVVMAIPLGLSLRHIATEALTTNEIRGFLNRQFGSDARVTQLDVDFESKPLAVRSVVIAPRANAVSDDMLRRMLQEVLHQPVALHIDQVLLDPGTSSLEAQRAQLRQAQAAAAATSAGTRVAEMLALAAGVPVASVTLDRDHQRATAVAAPLPGAGLAAYQALEARVAASADGWQVTVIPPATPLPLIGFANDSADLDPAARAAVQRTIWAAKRWNMAALAVPGLTADAAAQPPASDSDTSSAPLPLRRALAIAALLRQQGITPVSAAAEGQQFRLAAAPPPAAAADQGTE